MSEYERGYKDALHEMRITITEEREETHPAVQLGCLFVAIIALIAVLSGISINIEWVGKP